VHLPFRGRRGFRRFVPPPPEAHRINRNIRAPQVRLIGADGAQLGVMTVEDALRRAEDAQLDLVEVASNADPPVCRILDYGKFKYQQHKKESEAKRKQSTTTVKELRLGYRTDVGDLERQIQKARKFLDDGDRVKFSLRFRGREMAYQNLGREKLMRVCKALEDIASVEGSPRMEGRLMGVVLAPGVKKKAKPVRKAPAKAQPAEGKQPETAQPAEGKQPAKSEPAAVG
jgi:translation initiation factor IF-3